MSCPPARKGRKRRGRHITQCRPSEYIDDDLFGFMDARKETFKRTSPVRVSPLLALDPFEGDIDFGTNHMSVDSAAIPTSTRPRSTVACTGERS